MRILVVLVLMVLLSAGSQAAIRTVGKDDCDYYRIGLAISDAKPNDIIEVQSGIYYDNLNLTKSLVLRGVDTGGGQPLLVAGSSTGKIEDYSEGKRTEIVVPSGGVAITIYADGCTVEGLTIVNSTMLPDDELIGALLPGPGILVMSSGNVIRDNYFNNNCEGIEVCYSGSNNIIINNQINNCIINIDFMSAGINLRSKKNLVANNYLSGCNIDLSSESSNNIIYNNTIRDFTSSQAGIQLQSSNKYNILMRNRVENSTNGICLWESDSNILYENSVIENTEDGITLQESRDNFLVRNNASSNMNNGIHIIGTSDRDLLFGNNASGNDYAGIVLDGSNNIDILSNLACFNQDGIHLNESQNNSIQSNEARENNLCGIDLQYSINNTIIKNAIIQTFDDTGMGLNLENSSKNHIIKNHVESNPNGGIGLHSSSQNLILSNEVMDNGVGIGLMNGSQNNEIAKNEIWLSTLLGIGLLGSEDNQITNNLVYGNEKCIILRGSKNNLLHHNRFDGKNLAYDEGTSQWDDGAAGNCWKNLSKEFECIDANRDNICDSPFWVPGGPSVDRYPLKDLITYGEATTDETDIESWLEAKETSLQKISKEVFGDGIKSYLKGLEQSLGQAETVSLVIPEIDNFRLVIEPTIPVSLATPEINIKSFEFASWGAYRFADISDKRYFAAYLEEPTQKMLDAGESIPYLWQKSNGRDLQKNWQLSEVLMDDNEERTLTSGEPLKLEEEYELAIKSIDIDGNKVYLELSKDGAVVDSKVISPSKEGATMADRTYYYKSNVGRTEKIVQIAVYFRNGFQGFDQIIAGIWGVFQISDSPRESSAPKTGASSVSGPSTATDWINKGHDLYMQGKYDEAIKAYDEAIKLGPKYDAAWNNKGIALSLQGKYDDAIKCFDEAIRLDPKYANAWNNKGWALNRQGKYDDAIKAYDEAIRLDPKYANAWNNKGVVLEILGKTTEASTAFAKAKELGYKG